MHVILVRHGIAIDREDPTCPPDPERALTEKGRERTHYAALGLRELEVVPDAIFTSPYVRAVETAELVADALKVDRATIQRTEDLLPEADAKAVVAMIRGLSHGTVILTGHAPNLDLVLAALLDVKEAFTELKKAGAACVELHEKNALLRWLYEPRSLRKLGR